MLKEKAKELAEEIIEDELNIEIINFDKHNNIYSFTIEKETIYPDADEIVEAVEERFKEETGKRAITKINSLFMDKLQFGIKLY